MMKFEILEFKGDLQTPAYFDEILKPALKLHLSFYFVVNYVDERFLSGCSYGYTSEVGYGSSGHSYSGYGQVATHPGMQYDISADYVDYVDSTTAYDPRPTPGTPSVDTPPTDSSLMPSTVTTGKGNMPGW